MKDRLGNVLKIGDLLCYGRDRGEIDIGIIAGFRESKDYYNGILKKIKLWRVIRRTNYIRNYVDCNKDNAIFDAKNNKTYDVAVAENHLYLNGKGNYIVVCPETIGYEDIQKEVEKVKEERLKFSPVSSVDRAGAF